jgi:hypothetical protein
LVDSSWRRLKEVLSHSLRFAIGFVIGSAHLPVPSWAQGLIFGVLLSLPDAIITQAFAPIFILGAVGGTIIGIIVGKWGV